VTEARRGDRPVIVDPDTLARRLALRPVFLCLDYDGTLVPIAPRPSQAIFDDEGRRLLRALARRVPTAIVSGRARTTLRALVGVPALVYVGNHGLEISGPHLRHDTVVPRGWRRDLDRLLALIEADAPPGAVVERKGVTASVHYRLVGASHRRRWLPALRARLRSDVVRGGLRVVRGKAVVELRPPVDWDKGTAVRWLLSCPALAGRTPVYVGDDATDEDAFRAVRTNGIGVLVGRPRRSAARYRLPGPADVRGLLVRWLQVLDGRSTTLLHSL
jgi:trehalose-phosphatase